MLKLIIVEDEKVTRNGLIKIIDWESFGIEIVGVADNGKTGLDLINRCFPDIIITDIRMPIINGLELIKRTRDIVPTAQFMILTGYEDFSYAKEAIKLNVCEYLLKPVKIKELENAINKIVKKITEQKNINKNILQSVNIVNILEKEGDPKKILRTLKLAGATLPGPNFRVLIFSINHYRKFNEDDKNHLFSSFINMIETIFSSLAEVAIFKLDENQFLLLVSLDLKDREKSIELCKKALECSESYIKTTMTISAGSFVYSFNDIKKSYAEAYNANLSRFTIGPNQFIYNLSEPKKKEKAVCFIDDKEQELINKILLLDATGMQEIIYQVFSEVKEKQADFICIKEICRIIITDLNKKIYKLGMKINFLDCDYNILVKYDTMEEVREWLINYLILTIKKLEEYSKQTEVDIAQIAINYIKQNYNKDIGVCDIASACFVTPNYLSHLFKQQIGVNLIEWLNKYRIKKAKEYLLETNNKINQICQMVGFNSSKYFNYIFKKYTNCTPREYKKKKSSDYLCRCMDKM